MLSRWWSEETRAKIGISTELEWLSRNNLRQANDKLERNEWQVY